MSSTNSWLNRQRKSDLVELADHVGLENYESLKKSELEVTLDEWLIENENQFADDSKLVPYWQSRAKAIGSPVKREAPELKVARRRTIKAPDEVVSVESVPTVSQPVQRRLGQRRKTKVEERDPAPAPEIITAQARRYDTDASPAPTTATSPADTHSSNSDDEPTGSGALVHTPGRALSLASRIPLPATPADVANAVDRSTLAVRERVTELYKDSGITEVTHATRDSLSTVTSVLLCISAFELYYLRPEILSDRYAFTVPAISFLGTRDYPVHVPDMFLVLTSSFWSPALLWAFLGYAAPSFLGYFFNLSAASSHQAGAARGRARAPVPAPAPDYVVDPLTFSVAKAVLSYVVLAQGVTFGGWVDPVSVARIRGALFGGTEGVLVGCGVTALMSIYDAVLRK